MSTHITRPTAQKARRKRPGYPLAEDLRGDAAGYLSEGPQAVSGKS